MGICKSHCYYEPKVDTFKEIGERDWVLGVKKESVDPKRATPVIYIVFYYLDVGFEDKNVYNIDMLITNRNKGYVFRYA